MLLVTDIIASLKVRWRLELLVFIAILLVVIASALLSPKIYVATSSLLFDDVPVNPVGTQAGVDGLKPLLSTQSDVIKSEAVAADVVKSLQLVTPDILERWRENTGGNGDVNTWYGRQLLGGLNVGSVAESRVLE
ncbi:MAG: hypothetical protein EOO38_10010, partial [Cytophagaceae bacterium]